MAIRPTEHTITSDLVDTFAVRVDDLDVPDDVDNGLPAHAVRWAVSDRPGREFDGNQVIIAMLAAQLYATGATADTDPHLQGWEAQLNR